MRFRVALVVLAVILLGASQRRPVAKKRPAVKSVSTAISVDPVNPHYLRFRGHTGVLITSGEHYGAVLNSAFDYLKYLDTLHASGFNLVRVFNGAYLETLDSTVFQGGNQNTLAPRPGKYLAPWVNTGGKFDLSKWDETYFARLKGFVAEADKRNIAIEVTLFSVLYGIGRNGWGSWNLNPLNAANNINGTGDVGWDHFNTLDNKDLVAAQDLLVRKTVRELNGFDNVWYEVCNEPYFSGATAQQTRAWINHIISTIQASETGLPNRHLIAENVANGFAVIANPNPAVSIYNFHYASPPAALPLNWGLKKPIAFDETSHGCTSPDRRWEAWSFVFAGGAVYDNLDPSFTTDDATGKTCEGVRYELHNLVSFVTGVDLSHLQPDRDALQQWPLFSSEAYMLDDPGRIYAIYLKGAKNARITTIMLDAPAGQYQTGWFNPRTGDLASDPIVEHEGGPLRIQTPEYTEDIAIKLIRTGDAGPKR